MLVSPDASFGTGIMIDYDVVFLLYTHGAREAALAPG